MDGFPVFIPKDRLLINNSLANEPDHALNYPSQEISRFYKSDLGIVI